MRTIALVLVVVGCLAAGASGELLFCAVGWDRDFTHIDAAVGQVPPTHTDSPDHLQGLAWSPDGTLYAVASGISASYNRIYTLDPWTGIGEYVCDLDLPEGKSVRSLAISPDNQVYVGDGGPGPDSLLRVDLATGELVDSVFLTPETRNAQGLAFAPDGTLYGIEVAGIRGYRLTTIDPDGQTHIVGEYSGTADVGQSIAFTPDGRLFALGEHDSTVPNFAELDPTDGSVIGSAHSVSGSKRGLEFIPEPVMLPVLAVAALVVVRRRR